MTICNAMRFALLLLTFVTAPRLLFAAEPVRFSEHLLADRWYKGLDDQPTDESGRIVPYKNNCMASHR